MPTPENPGGPTPGPEPQEPRNPAAFTADELAALERLKAIFNPEPTLAGLPEGASDEETAERLRSMTIAGLDPARLGFVEWLIATGRIYEDHPEPAAPDAPEAQEGPEDDEQPPIGLH